MTTTTKKNTKNKVPKGESTEAQHVDFRSREERLVAGRVLRDSFPRKSHGKWELSPKRRDPITVLEESNRDRLPELIPIRYGRMLRSPFTFLRGSAGADGLRPGRYPEYQDSGAGLRRLSSHEFWSVCHPRAQSGIRY